MKVNRILYVTILGLLALPACENESFVQDFVPEGAMVYFSPGEQDSGVINFLDLDGTNLNFEVSMTDEQGRDLEFAPVASVDILATFTNTSTGGTHQVMLQNLTQWPQTFSYTLDEFLAQFPSEVVTRDSLELGDNFFITADFNMEDGRKLSGWSPALLDNSPASIYRVFVSYNVACPSEIPSGTWVEVGDNDVAETTLTKIGAATYEFSDFNVDYYGTDLSPIRGVFSDICNTLTLEGATEFSIAWRGRGVYDPVNQTITFEQVEDMTYNPGIFSGPYVFEYRGE